MDWKGTKKDTPVNKKWSLGRFFRKKKEFNSDSTSDGDHKAGFIATQKPQKNEKRKFCGKIVSPAFNNSVIHPKTNDINDMFLVFETINSTERLQSNKFTERLGKREKRYRSSRLRSQQHSSSDEDTKSHNSSTILRYRSDESLGSAGVSGKARSRTARTERYYKRMSRDKDMPTDIASQQVRKSKVQPTPPNKCYCNKPSQELYQRNMANTNSVPNMQSVYSVLGSVSPDSNIHLEKIFNSNMEYVKRVPPPPPPRNPSRRMNEPGQSLNRPMSYAFDKSAARDYYMNSRCISDNKLWGAEENIYQSGLQRHSSGQPSYQPRRFITRACGKISHNQQNNDLVSSDFRYIADAVPRSRKPIHVLKSSSSKLGPSPDPASINSAIRTTKSESPLLMKQASHFWRQIDQQEMQRQGRPTATGTLLSEANKSQSVSNSRANQGQLFNTLSVAVKKTVDDENHVVSGKLYLKSTKESKTSVGQAGTKLFENKSNSMPNFYQRQLQQIEPNTKSLNKYEEHITRKASQNFLKYNTSSPPVPQRKAMNASIEDLRKSATNLEEAINELEAIYNSLKLSDDELLDRAERRDLPAPRDFSKYAVVSDEDEELDNGEPNVVSDDVAYRNTKRANMLKIVERQPPFGIPMRLVPPAPKSGYHNVNPDKNQKETRCIPKHVPDLVSDDLAVRALRKDVSGLEQPSVFIPNNSKKKRAVRSASANIYSMIQRDAAKPAGGNLLDYFDNDHVLSKAESFDNVRREVDDIPSTFKLLRILKNEKEGRKTSSVMCDLSQAEAVFNLPSTLKTSLEIPYILQKPPIPPTGKSFGSEPAFETCGMEEALKRIAHEAKQSSLNLSRTLNELRNGKINPIGVVQSPELIKLKDDTVEIAGPVKISEEALVENLTQPQAAISRTIVFRDERKPTKNIDEISERVVLDEKNQEKIIKAESPVNEEPVEEFLEASSVLKNVDPVSDNSLSEKQSFDTDLINFSDDSDKPTQSALDLTVPPNDLRPNMRINSLLSPLKMNNDRADYNNFNSDVEVKDSVPCSHKNVANADYDINCRDHVAAVSKSKSSFVTLAPLIRQVNEEEDIDRIMKECEGQVIHNRASTSISASDCPRSSATESKCGISSSTTSIHGLFSSECMKPSSVELHTPRPHSQIHSDPIKTVSTSFCDVNSSSSMPNVTSSVSTSTSQLLALIPANKQSIGKINDSRNASQSTYNSSEEFGTISSVVPGAITSTPSPPESAATSELIPIATKPDNGGNTKPIASKTKCCN